MPKQELSQEEAINEATLELTLALKENLEASKAQDKVQIRKMKAQKRLSMARDEVRALTTN